MFVRFAGGLSSLAPKAKLSESPLAEIPPELFPVGSAVWAFVSSVDTAGGRLVLSLKPSDVAKAAPATAPAPGSKRKTAAPAPAPAGEEEEEAAPAPARPEGKRHHELLASELSVGSTVQCRVEATSVVLSDAVGIAAGVPNSKAFLSVTLLGVGGRYKARLCLAECCDVCPITGAVLNSEGFSTFKRLAECSATARAPVFRAKVVVFKAGKQKSKKGSEETKEGAVEMELTVRACVYLPCVCEHEGPFLPFRCS